MAPKRMRSTPSTLLLSLTVLTSLSSRPSTIIRPSIGAHAFTTYTYTSRTNDNFDLARRFERADKAEMRNDATLVASYVLARFLVWDVTSGAKVQPGWEVQDFVYLSGTFASATILVVYYAIAGLLSRTYEAENTPFANVGPAAVVRAVVNVVLCTPVWLATEHALQYGPDDIGGPTLATTVASGFLGFGSFMALAKTITAGMR
ncbi:hypothetical protein ACHAXT_008431 [Thalassiosira profunda]